MDEKKVNKTLASSSVPANPPVPISEHQNTKHMPVVTGIPRGGRNSPPSATLANGASAAPASEPTAPAATPAVSAADSLRARFNAAVGGGSAGLASGTTAGGEASATENAGSATSSSTSTSETTIKPKFAYEDPELSAHINDMYDAYGNARRIALQEAGDQALSDAQANRDKIAQQYQTQRNMASVDWERQRRNFLEGANMNGLNTGAVGQAQLAMQGRYQQTQNQLGYQQANAEAEADRNMADIKRQTQAKINEAIAENDYKRAAALLDQYNVMYSRALEEAKARAAYGDFGGYGTLYGEDASTQMANMWYAQNPDLAYMMGLITADQRANLKERKPMNAARGGGGYYGGSSGGEWAGNIKNSWLSGSGSVSKNTSAGVAAGAAAATAPYVSSRAPTVTPTQVNRADATLYKK